LNPQWLLDDDGADAFVDTTIEVDRTQAVVDAHQTGSNTEATNVLARLEQNAEWTMAILTGCKGENYDVYFVKTGETRCVTVQNVKTLDWKYWRQEMQSWTCEDFKNSLVEWKSQKDWIKQNRDNINFDEAELNKEETKVFKQILKNEKISEKAKGRLRYKGKFINKEAETRIRKFLKKVPLTKENIENAFEKELFFTFRSNEISDVLNDHKGPIKLNGEPFELPEAIIEFDTLNAENFEEWSEELDIDKSAIFFIVYDATYNPETKTLDIDTMVNDETRVVTSDPEIKKKRAEEKAAKKEALKLAKENKKKK
jgi:hypothetical protein